MISIYDFCQNISIELTLLELIKGLSTLMLITAVALVVKIFVGILKKERIVDDRIRETRARIAQVVLEMGLGNESSKKETGKMTRTGNRKATLAIQPNVEKTIDSDRQRILEAEVPIELPKEVKNIHKVSEETFTEKKTRAMSMEERWAEFDKKRAMKDTA